MAWNVDGFDPIGRLGSGSTGNVVKATDIASGTPVAIKYVSKGVSGNPGFKDTFRTNGARLPAIENPNIAQVYGYVDDENGSVTITEFVDGVSLRSILASGGALEPQAALYVVKGALTGLAAAHRRGVVHGDVTPNNLIIDRNGTAKVVDFGIAARYRSNAPAPGNPLYLAPEMWVGRPATPESDVFSATAVLLEALTGTATRSTSGGYLGNAGAAVADAEPAAVLPELPARVRALITRGLASPSAKRFPDAGAMADALVFAAVGAYGFEWEEAGRQLLLARMASAATGRPPMSSGRRRVLVAAVVGVIAIVLAAAATIALTSGDRAKTPLTSPAQSPTAPQIDGVSAPPPDTASPAQPMGLRVTSRAQTAVSLAWLPAQDNVGVIGYAISRNGVLIAHVTTPNFTDSRLTAGTTYSYSVVAADAAGNVSPPSLVIVVATLTAPDTTPPAVPTGLHSTGRTRTSVVLIWTASRDNVGVAGYDVLRNGRPIAAVARPDFTDVGLQPATAYSYTVRAYDATGNRSALSSPVTAITLTAADVTPPSPPRSVHAAATGTSTVHVSWTAGTDNVGVTSYTILRDGVPVAMSTGLTYDDYGLSPATAYRYRIESVDAAGHPSIPSVLARVTTDPLPQVSPTPPPPTPVVTGIHLSATDVTAPTCTTSLTATVTETGGLATADVQVVVDGVSQQPVTVTFDAMGNATAIWSDIAVIADGTATATVVGTSYSDSASWSTPPECAPQPSPSPSDSPTPDAVASQ